MVPICIYNVYNRASIFTAAFHFSLGRVRNHEYTNPSQPVKYLSRDPNGLTTRGFAGYQLNFDRLIGDCIHAPQHQ